MSVQHTNFNTSQDKGQTGQEVNNQELIKKNSPDNRLASILLAVAFYLAIVYLALFLLLGLSNPWGIVIMIFLAPNLISFIIATILTRIGRKKGNKNFLYTSVIFYLVSIFLAYDLYWPQKVRQLIYPKDLVLYCTGLNPFNFTLMRLLL